MASPSSLQNRRSTPTYIDHTESDAENDAAAQFRRSGNARQARRLQLRNAGFRGPAVPTRKVTPTSPASSTWSTIGEPELCPSNENAPRYRNITTTPARSRQVSGPFLRDISNSASIRPAKTRQRNVSGRISDSSDSPGDHRRPSPTYSKGTIRARSAKTRAKVAHGRRSVSGETSKYIEHLESELAATQSQLARINSPTVTRQQSSKIRNMDAEARQLQQEVEQWEAKYEQRVQEEVDRYRAVDASLRGRIRTLEQDAEEAHFRIRELETQIVSAAQNMQAVETANINLERRVEIMSELLAASPSKIDLHPETPGRGRKHVRPKSMLPRFPTAGSLLGSPERQPHTQPTSPLLTFTNYSPEVPSSPAQSAQRLDITSEQSDYISEAESVFSEASATGDSVTSAENFDGLPGFNPWHMPPPATTTRTKPARRMRRFGAGSVGPKPLILPSTSACDSFPPSLVPPLERSETMPTFSPAEVEACYDGSPLPARRRASTMANGELLGISIASPFLNASGTDDCDVTLMDLQASSSSRPGTRDSASTYAGDGPNLMDELTAACSDEVGMHSDVSFEAHQSGEHGQIDKDLQKEGTNPANPSVASETWHRTATPLTVLSRGSTSRERSPLLPPGYFTSAFERLRFLFGDLWLSPLDLARHLVQTVQSCLRIPRTLLNVQWWLVGALLGPMARRRMQSHHNLRHDGETDALLFSDPGHGDSNKADRMAYGAIYGSPSTSSKRSASSVSGRGKKRTGHKVRCPHRRARHSPLVWIKFSITLAIAIGAAFKDGPASLLKTRVCPCQRKRAVSEHLANEGGWECAD